MGAVLMTGLPLADCRALTLEELDVLVDLKGGRRKRRRR
jgi:hypothetical protein